MLPCMHRGAAFLVLPALACTNDPAAGNDHTREGRPPELAASGAPACPRIAAVGFTRGGQTFYHLWTGGDSLGRDLETTIRDGHYDVIVIAESISLAELAPPYADFVDYADLIIEAARASGAKPLLCATPYVDRLDRWGFREMAAPQLALGRARGVTVAAGGLAWLRVWEELPSVELHHPDHAHPGYKGSLVSAMVLYSAITGFAPFALSASPPTECTKMACPPVTEEEGAVFRRAAWAEAKAWVVQ